MGSGRRLATRVVGVFGAGFVVALLISPSTARAEPPASPDEVESPSPSPSDEPADRSSATAPFIAPSPPAPAPTQATPQVSPPLAPTIRVLPPFTPERASVLPEDRGLTSEFYAKGKLRKKLVALDDGDPPAPYVEKTRPHRGMLLTGSIMFGAGHAVTAATAAMAWSMTGWFGSEKDSSYLWGTVPLAGPFIIAAEQSEHGDISGIYVGLGLVQATGVGLLVASLATDQRVWVIEETKTWNLSVAASPGFTGLVGGF